MPSNPSPPSIYDPYEPRPTWAQRHADRVVAGVVFLFTVVLAVMAFPPSKAPEAAYAMLVPGIFWAYTRPSLKLYAATMFAAQAVAWTILLGWLHNVTWVGLFLLGPFVGAWVGVWYLAAWWTMPRMIGRPTPNRLIAMLGLAAGWVLIEWTRTWLLGGFPWLPLAASQWERTTILQIASYTGAHGVSFVLVMMNIGFAAYAHRLFREKNLTGFSRRSQEFFLALFILLGCVCVHFQDAFNRGQFSTPLGRVAFVQPNIPQDVKWDAARGPAILEVLQKTTLEAAATRPDLVLWPEAVTPWAIRGDEKVKNFVESLVRRTRVPLVLGSIAIENVGTADERWVNGAFVVTPQEGLREQYYAKRELVPFGEYIPLRPVLGWLRKFVPIGDDFSPGGDSSPLLVPIGRQQAVFGPLICYEDIFPQLASDSVHAGANVLVVLTNNGWFGEGGAAYQHAAHSVLRAVETRRPVLRCGNGGWSGWIDEFGSVRSVATDENSSIYFRGSRTINVTRDARWAERKTYYTDHGDWFVLVCVGLMAFGAAISKIGAPGLPAEEATAGQSAEIGKSEK